MTLWNWQQYLQLNQQTDDRYDSVNGVLVYHAGMEKNSDHISLIDALSELVSRI